eukprot:scaffold8850_cov72-Phaeocystis_antarctica.AAC.13
MELEVWHLQTSICCAKARPSIARHAVSHPLLAPNASHLPVDIRCSPRRVSHHPSLRFGRSSNSPLTQRSRSAAPRLTPITLAHASHLSHTHDASLSITQSAFLATPGANHHTRR